MDMDMHYALREISHRPWPLPDEAWLFAMNWHDLLFAHWPVNAELIRKFLPPALELETYDGSAWLGVVPFRMTGVRPRCLPAFSLMSDFLELNVRTYVKAQDKPGVWFFSLDAAQRLAVRAARLLFKLPYYDARMSLNLNDQIVKYSSQRTHRNSPKAQFLGRYGPCSDTFFPLAGTFEHWLTERYCLYSANKKGKILRTEIQHAPWCLQRAQAEIEINTMGAQLGLDLVKLRQSQPVLHFSKIQNVIGWNIKSI